MSSATPPELHQWSSRFLPETDPEKGFRFDEFPWETILKKVP
jgi:hypothetical protein